MRTKKISIILVFAIAISILSCNDDSIDGNKLDLLLFKESISGVSKSNDSFNKGFLSPRIMGVVNIHDTIKTTSDIPTSRDDLGKMRMVVKIYNGEDNAGIAIPGFGGLKLGREESNVNVYYIETIVVNKERDSIVYGCGYSIHYLFKKVKRGVSIDNLPSVAASAQLNSNKTQVYYSMQTYGIIGKNLVKYFKPTINKNFNVEGFGIMQSSIDGIHNILGDSILSNSVNFKPEILKFVKPYELEQLN